MDFRGHLRLPRDAGSGIPVVLRLDDIYVIISAEGEELGAWRADDVQIDRIFSNQFALDLDGEPMVFIAADALGFAYEGVTAINELRERLTKRKVFKRGRKKAVPPAPSEIVPGTPVAKHAPVLPPAPEPAGEPAPAPPIPQDEPVTLSTPTRLWTPPAARTPAPTEPEPVHVEAQPMEPTEPPPVDERVSYETEPKESRLVEPSPVDERVSYETPSPPPPPPARHQSDEAPQPVPVADLFDPVEIEEVAPAAASEYTSSSPVEVELEIDDYVMPAAGTADTYAAPTPRHETHEPPPRPVEGVVEPGIEPRILPPSPSPRPVPTETAQVPPERVETQAEEAVEEPVAELVDEPVEAAPVHGFNGHNADETLEAVPPAVRPEEIEGSRRDRRKHSLFGRSKDRKEPEHEHKYGPPNTIGGLTRSVCEGCGHVTFSSQDVYQDW